MHVALVAPLVAPVRDEGPPLGGVEVFLRDLTAGLVERGVQVTLVAADGSSLPGVECPRLGIDAKGLAPANLSASAEAERPDVAEQRIAFGKVRDWCAEHAASLDVVHAHAFDAPAFDALAELPDVCVMHTLHLPPIQSGVVHAARRAAAADGVLIGVSAALASTWQAAGVPVARVVQNGIDVGRMPFGATHQGYAVCAGRISPEKGPEIAVAAAEAAGLPLLLVGNLYDHAFFDAQLRPVVTQRLDWTARNGPHPRGATYIGHRARAAVLELMAGAAATLMPVRWDEPFGLVAIEAQAAGSPVVAFERGALGEVIRDGQTGVLVREASELPAAIGQALLLDRAACRRWVAERYSLRSMVEAYLAVYREVAS